MANEKGKKHINNMCKWLTNQHIINEATITPSLIGL